ncbi:helix-turn-helix domain-containing protein [Paenibacillus sp. NPDC057967]|uniref:helix-turn-helix domain-containing protein n=1 Tax=Paenibacillus sp. NPDC057967 TaxID=3346293 RepID=UPI0036DF1CEA
MDWEAHIERWSRTAVQLLDIRQYCMENGTVPDHYGAHTCFFVVTTSGEAKLELSGTIYRTRSLHILHGGKGATLRFMPLGTDFACYLILYKAVCISQEDQEGFHLPYAFIPYASLPLQEKCQEMDRLWQQSNPMDKLQAQAAFLPFVYEVMRQIRSTATENNKINVVTEAIHYIQEHFRESMTAEDLAGRYSCSASYLSRLFKNQIGIGPIDYLIHVRIHKSKQFLLKSEARIQEIASSVGYADVYYFSRLFKKHAGCSPLQFRENDRQTVQHNPFPLLKSSIVSLNLTSHNENESYYQQIGEGDTSMFRFSRPTLGVMMLLCTALLLNACQTGSKDSDTENTAVKTRIYEHLQGQTSIPVKPQRVVSLFHLGELMALGVKPVGTTSFVLKNPLLSDTSGIADIGVPPDAEKILSLEPDLIVTTGPFAEVFEGGYEALSKIAPTIVVEQYNDPIKDVEMFGDILGKQKEAQQWNKAFEAKIAKYKEQISPFVGADETFSILNVRTGSLFVYGDTNMGGNIIYKYLGLKPQKKVESDVIHGETWEISAEVIPEFIGERLFLAVNEGAEEDMKKLDKLIQHSPAGKAGKIYNIDFDQFLPSDPISVEQQLDIIVDLLKE